MQSVETTPRFRNLSVTPHFRSTSFSLIDEKQEEKPNLEKQCFMCRQANVYIKPIGMQQERRIARRHPPPLSRAQIEELSEKKYLTKREVRTLLQCYFPEIKNVKYFQLHKYHSCCYDPKHLNLCKNHITALQREREQYPNHHFHEHQNDEKHLKEYEKNGKNPNRVSFVRIKIEPTKGIPTRFLGPTALPESLADMLIKQVNRFENKKKLPTFNNTQTQSALEFNQVGKLEQPYENGVNHFSEHLVNLDSDDDDDDHDDDDDSDSYSGSDEENTYTHTPNSNIHGYTGQIRTRSRMKYERQLQTQERKEVSTSTHNKNGDLIVEDVDDLTQLYVHEQDPVTMNKTSKGLKKKKRRRRRKRRTRAHQKPKLNHWEIMALDHSQQEVCGCRHHVRRLEADQVVYDWCRCKDHTHKGLKERRKSVPPPPAPPPSPPQKPRKVRKKNTGINATEPTTTELALAYDPTTVDYDVIQEVLYYRTSSGRLVKPEITNRFGFNNVLSGKGHDHRKVSLNNAIGSSTTPRGRLENVENHSQKNRSSMTDSPILSNLGSGSNDHISKDTETHRLTTIDELLDSSTPKNGQMYGDDDDEDDNDDDDDGTVQFMPPKYLPEIPEYTPTQSPTIPTSIQKSSKPIYMNQRPTPNFDRESSLIANRRWFDQPLGDQNLNTLQDGRYGLIAGTTTENYQLESQMPDNDYVEPIRRKNRSNCTIS